MECSLINITTGSAEINTSRSAWKALLTLKTFLKFCHFLVITSLQTKRACGIAVLGSRYPGNVGMGLAFPALRCCLLPPVTCEEWRGTLLVVRAYAPSPKKKPAGLFLQDCDSQGLSWCPVRGTEPDRIVKHTRPSVRSGSLSRP